MLGVLVDIAEHGQSESARVNAADKILDRALGKAPQHVDLSALRQLKSSTVPPRKFARR
jgi:hypothetical protein